MKYLIDHDYHIHTQISQCSSDPEQTPERILEYARKKGLKRVVITDHFWDENVPGASNWYYTYHKFSNISAALPLPEDESVKLLFGCETDMDKHGVIGISVDHYNDFDFIIVATTHMHMKSFTVEDEDYCNAERLARLWVDRFDTLLNADLPFHKVGVAHLTTACIAVEGNLHYEVLDLIPESEMTRLFTKAAELGLGVELNGSDFYVTDEYIESVIRPYRIAKACGCKFYLGSDAHKPREFSAFNNLSRVIDMLRLTEDDKFYIPSNIKHTPRVRCENYVMPHDA